MDIIYDSSTFDLINHKELCLDLNQLAYLKRMTKYITNISNDIYKNIVTKSLDLKIEDVLDALEALEKIQPITISAIIICMNEEKYIKKCIESIQSCQFDEIIVVDTGSTDSTIDILQSLQEQIPQLKIYHTEWKNDFSQVRNYGLKLAKSEWVFFIDADEYYLNQEEHSIKEIISFFSIYYNDDLCMCPNIINSNNHELYNNPRIFKRIAGYQYYGNVHEMLRKNKNSYDFVPNIGLNIKFGHDGYRNDIFITKNKESRNVDLLMKCIEMEPNNPLWKCYLVRDGMRKLSTNYIIQLCEETINLCEARGNYFFTYCYYWAHTLLIDLYISMKEIEKADPLIKNLRKNNAGLDETDIYYREQLIYMIKIEKDLEIKLNEVKKYRENHSKTNGSALNTHGYHLDDLIMRLNYFNHNMDEYHQYKNYLYQLNYLV
ncbi:glycosyltransferase family 2 protein [Bacillus sp. 22475]|uniref:glycosyltransferase family 2 protein n=1 Tax=Bacillus sp. 22475 TaxID=3453925 RepID=UPI003F83D5AB